MFLGVENKLVLCSSKDKFVLTQDLCVMCGAIGTDSEGCLIACSQCGQTYHPYCVSIKVSIVSVLFLNSAILLAASLSVIKAF